MSEKSFQSLQKEMITKLSNSFEISRADILKIEPTLHEWTRQLKKLEHLKDENNLHHYLLTNLDISEKSKTHLDTSTQDALLAPLKQSIQAYLDFLPQENFARANEIISTIHGLTFSSYESISEFVKLRSELSKQLNNHITSKCQRIQSEISNLLKNFRSQLHNLPPEQSTLLKTDFQSKKAHNALTLFENFNPSLPEELATVRVKRYNLTLTNEDLLSLKDNAAPRPQVVDFFGNYLNERNQGDSGTLFLRHRIAHALLENRGVQDELPSETWETYERICIPYTDEIHIKWCLIIIEKKGKIVWVTDFGQGILEENKLKLLVSNLREKISKSPEKNECTITRIAYGGETNDVGSPLLWEMYGLAIKDDNSRGEKERTKFAQLLFQTLLLIGTHMNVFLKFDELL